MAHETIGRYALHGPISSGGMASVHYGRLLGPIGFSRTVAIKRLHAAIASDPEHAAMFLDEARLSARIHHPNVVATLDVVEGAGPAGDELLLVMAYVAGPSLSALNRIVAQQSETLPAAHAVSIMLGALHGLHAAHEAKGANGELLDLVHRDVSPQNILIGEDGVARVIDFGIAKAVERVHMTRGNEIRGKILYMAPEQLARQPVDRRADIYAASVVLWELLAGRRLIELGDVDPLLAMDVVRGHEPGPPSDFAPGLPAALDAVVLRGLARDPAARYQTALEMATALEAALVPSGQREVSAWVGRVAGDMLRERAAVLHEIESERELPAAASSAQMVPIAPSSRGTATIAEGPTGKAWAQGAVAPKRFDARPIAVAAAIVAIVVAWVAGTHRGAATPTTALGSAPPSALTVLAPVSTSDPSAAPSASVAAVAIELPSTEPTGAKPNAHRPGAKPKGCNPPYTVDHGIRVPKPECR